MEMVAVAPDSSASELTPEMSRPRSSFGVSVAPTLKLRDTVVGLFPR